MQNKYGKIAMQGIVSNPVFVLALGMCPTIAQSTTIEKSLGLGLATAFVLICSNLMISLLRNVIPDKVRLPAYIIIIATFVTVIQLVMQAYLREMYDALGAFIALIVVNCIVFARAEAFASKNAVLPSVVDGITMGAGFVFAIVLLGAVRQALVFAGFAIFEQAAGGFIALGLLMALYNVGLNAYLRATRKAQFASATAGSVSELKTQSEEGV